MLVYVELRQLLDSFKPNKDQFRGLLLRQTDCRTNVGLL